MSQLAVGVCHGPGGVMPLVMGVLQFVMEMAGVGILVSHLPALCTRIPAGMSAAGAGVLRGALLVRADPAAARCVSYVVGDSAVVT